MADLIIKPSVGTDNKLIIQNQAGNAVLTTDNSGVTLGTVVAASRPGVRQFIQNTTETETNGTFGEGAEVEIVGMNVAITPTASDSRLLVTFSCGGMGYEATLGVGVHIKRVTGGVTTMARKVARYAYTSNGTGWHYLPISVNYLDTPTIPSTPIEIVYQMYMESTAAKTFEMNPNSESASDRAGVVTVMELAPN